MKYQMFNVKTISVFKGLDKSNGQKLFDNDGIRMFDGHTENWVYEVEYQSRGMGGADENKIKIVSSNADLLKLFINTFQITRDEYNSIYVEEIEEKLRNK